MTREEKLKILRTTAVTPDMHPDDFGKWDEALRSAIEALSAEPCEDAISRKAVFDVIHSNSVWENEYNLTSSRIKKAVENLPSVILKQKMGRWEWVQYDYNPKLGNWHCSECRSIVVMCVSKEEEGGIPLYKYCPNCGCRMKGESE